MAKRRRPPELTFQQHIADFLVREHKYGVLEQSDITDTEHCIAEDHLWAFLKATQAETLKKLADDYGTDARDEVFKALRKELEHTPLWMILRHGLKVRGLEFRIFYPKPRSTDSTAVQKHGENRITFRPHFYYGETNKEIDFVFFLNGLPIVDLEVKHERNQNVHDAVSQFAARDHAKRIFRHPFLYLAADTSDVMAATDPRRVENFRWHNTGLTNVPQNPSEYPVEFLYREVLSKDQLLNIRVVSIGLIDRSPVHPREVFADALSDRASAIIVAHNHPGGGVEPSPSDINITAQLKAAGAIVGIELLDHIIFNRNEYFSFLEAGRL
jgi:type I restriction enzyme R subunit